MIIFLNLKYQQNDQKLYANKSKISMLLLERGRGGEGRDTRGEQIVRENTESLKRRFEKLKLVLDSINYLGDSLKKSVSYNQGTGNNIEKTLWLENFQQF